VATGVGYAVGYGVVEGVVDEPSTLISAFKLSKR
jgi:hypothetical protein